MLLEPAVPVEVTEANAAKLRDVGLKVTRNRLKVLETLGTIGGHRSADEIYQALLSDGNRLPRGSIFKIMGDLCQYGLVMMADAGPGRTLYEYTDVWHHHFVCRNCGMIQDVPCVEGRKPCLLPDEPVAGWIDEAQIIFRGICSDCQPLEQDATPHRGHIHSNGEAHHHGKF